MTSRETSQPPSGSSPPATSPPAPAPPASPVSEEIAAGSEPAAGQANRGSTFPVAGIQEANATAVSLILQSKMWWVTLACLVIAFWLTWRSIPSRGPTIMIRFPDGHGLKAGDVVRHRGIEAGTVDSVALSEDLTQINASVTLTPGAAGLAREGTRFWIVRPQVSLAGISGLDTAVGAKYIGVSPGASSGQRQSSFDGLSAAPPDENRGDEIDIVLRSDSKHGVSVGAPVNWRGVEVGQVLSVNLSPDARFVDVHAQIRAEYRRLLRTTSQFWVTSGLGVDIGLSGVRLDADSLSTIVRGGVSFATPTVSNDRTSVTSGHMFVLHEKPDPEWLTAAASLPLIDFELPPTVTIQGTRKTSLLGISRNRTFTTNGLLVRGKDNTLQILTASDIFPTGASESDDEGTPPVEFVIGTALADAPLTISSSAQPASDSGFAWLPCPDAARTIPSADFSILREPQQPEECCICRSVNADNQASSVIQSIGRDQLQATDLLWSVSTDLGDLSPWHGAPVVSMQDGKVIGVFLVGKAGAMIAPYRQQP